MSQAMQKCDARPRGLMAAIQALEKRFGLDFPDYKSKELMFNLQVACAESGRRSLDQYLDDLATGALGLYDLDRLIELVTVSESYFLRHEEQFQCMIETLIPELDGELVPPGERVRVWSAGCARGEEPYSVALKIDQCLPALHRRVEIVGTDINECLLDHAREGLYSDWSVRGLSTRDLEGYFIMEDQFYRLRRRVRTRVDFVRHNLAGHLQTSPFGPLRPVHLVICRNVLIYFSREQAARTLQSLLDSLAPGGYLLLGPSESLLEFDSPFEEVKLGAVTAYRRPPAFRPGPVPSGIFRRSRTDLDFLKRRLARQGSPAGTTALPGDESGLIEAVSRALAMHGRGDSRDALALLMPFNGALDADLARIRIIFDLRDAAGIAKQCRVLRQRHPGHVAGYLFSALHAIDLHNPEQAIPWLRKSLYLDRGLIAGHIHLAAACRLTGRSDESSRAWKNAERLLGVLDPELEVPFCEGQKARDLLGLIRDKEDRQ